MFKNYNKITRYLHYLTKLEDIDIVFVQGLDMFLRLPKYAFSTSHYSFIRATFKGQCDLKKVLRYILTSHCEMSAPI